jgi:indole-3-glycerol phosphate synthase
MNTLKDIIARKRVEVARAVAMTPLDAVIERARAAERPRNFFAAAVEHRQRDRGMTRIIAEIKRKSPSAGEIRAEFDPVAIAKQYHEAGAAAISCLTDEADFGGHLGYIRQIKAAVPLPVLRKDFIVDPYQVWESRAAGADAILLIGEVLGEGELLDLMILARELGMTTLVEVHSLDTLLKVRNHIGFPHSGYGLLGINNRDLTTMKTDVAHTTRMIEFVENKSIVVSESGISSPADLARLRRHGVRIALVGEYLLRQPDPGAALRSLLDSR